MYICIWVGRVQDHLSGAGESGEQPSFHWSGPSSLCGTHVCLSIYLSIFYLSILSIYLYIYEMIYIYIYIYIYI